MKIDEEELARQKSFHTISPLKSKMGSNNGQDQLHEDNHCSLLSICNPVHGSMDPSHWVIMVPDYISIGRKFQRVFLKSISLIYSVIESLLFGYDFIIMIITTGSTKEILLSELTLIMSSIISVIPNKVSQFRASYLVYSVNCF